jgi:hypothetical protein
LWKPWSNAALGRGTTEGPPQLSMNECSLMTSGRFGDRLE